MTVNWEIFGLYCFAAFLLIYYIIKYADRRFGKIIWLGWVLLVLSLMAAYKITPDLPILPFWHDVVWAYGAIALISRTLYSIKARKNGRNYQHLTYMASILRTNFGGSFDFDSGLVRNQEATSERRSDS